MIQLYQPNLLRTSRNRDAISSVLPRRTARQKLSASALRWIWKARDTKGKSGRIEEERKPRSQEDRKKRRDERGFQEPSCSRIFIILVQGLRASVYTTVEPCLDSINQRTDFVIRKRKNEQRKDTRADALSAYESSLRRAGLSPSFR